MSTNKKKTMKELPGLSKQTAFLENIDERRLAKDMVRHSEKKYRSLISHIPDVVWIADKKGHIIFISQNSKAITGCTPEEEYEIAQHATWFDRIHPDDVGSTKAAYKALIEKGKPYNVEYRFKRKGGGWIWFHDRAVATYEEDGIRYADGIASDITERKEAEAEIKRLKEKYESLIRNIPVAAKSCLPDETATMIFISERYKDWTGYSPEDFYKDPELWPKTVHPEDRAKAVKAWVKACENKAEYNDEYRVVHRGTGQVRWVKDHGVPVKDEKGDVIMYDGIITDITARKEVEVEIKRLKEKYESLIRNIPCVVDSALPDETGSMSFVSDRYKDWTGYSPEDFYKDAGLWPKVVHPEDRARAVKAWIEACENKAEFHAEYRVVHKDTGQVRWVKDHGVPVKDEKGDVVMYNGVMVDATERKRAELALQESEEFSSSLLENSPNPIVVINSDTSIRYVNPALIRMTGFTGKELLGMKPPYPWWMQETLQKASGRLQKAMRERMMGTEELFQKKGGERFWVEVSSTPVMSNGQFKYLLISWVDVSEQKQLREDLQHYIREVVMAQEVERKRISRELHDETVQALADLCTDVDVIKMEGKISKKVIRQMDRHRLKIQGVMHELRRFSHELRPGLLDYFGLIPSLESLAQEWRSEGKINCHVEVIGSEQRLSSEAELLLFRITQEALRNAKKHSDATETVVRIEFICDKVKLNVSDNGSGFQIPKELASFTRRGKLGLMGMKERANLLGGSFRLQSKSGKGTTVTVEIPADIDHGVM